MTRQIRKLPTALANKIAAGEVVERPASVVKELIENSIDAGATQITITIEKSGLPRIQVSDNGCGIEHDDLPLAIASHATSKLHEVDDLNCITSLGFRGEALASIASVSHFKLQSRVASCDVGYELTNRHDTPKVSTVAHPVGTTMITSDLFYNVPARRKFLRSDKTEFNHIEETVRRTALSCFDIGFTLIHNKRTLWQLPIANSPIEKEKRLAVLLGNVFLSHCFHIDVERAPLKLSGWIATPEIARSQLDRQYSFINGRVVRDKLMNHAIRQAYTDLLPTGRYPSVVLFLECDPRTVDVNVHPTKHEVRFHDARFVHDFIVRSIQDTLTYASQSEDMEHDSELLSQNTTNKIIDSYQRETWQKQGKPNVSRSASTHSPIKKKVNVVEETKNNENILGVFNKRYLLIEQQAGLSIFDIKRLYADWVKRRLTKKAATYTVKVQPLLVPVRYPASNQRIAQWTTHKSTLEQLGIQANQLDNNILAVRYIPVLLSQVNIRQLFDKLFSEFDKKIDTPLLTRLIVMLANVAAEQLCHDPLTEADIQRLQEIMLEWPDLTPYRHVLTADMVGGWFG